MTALVTSTDDPCPKRCSRKDFKIFRSYIYLSPSRPETKRRFFPPVGLVKYIHLSEGRKLCSGYKIICPI